MTNLSFHVQGSAQPHVVTLFRKQSCSCATVSHCSHWTAAKIMLGIPHSVANTSLNAGVLLRCKRRGIGRRTGHKQPKCGEKHDYEGDIDCAGVRLCTLQFALVRHQTCEYEPPFDLI